MKRRKALAGILANMCVLSACSFSKNTTKGIEEC